VEPLAIIATGMITGVGLDAPSSCAAIRGRIDRFEETRFIDRGGEWILGSEVPLDTPLRGRAKLIELASSVISECLNSLRDVPSANVPLLLCVAESSRPGRLSGLDDSLLTEIASKLGTNFHSSSQVIAGGHVGGVEAIEQARNLIDHGHPYCLVVGVDSFLVTATLARFEKNNRLLTSTNSNGFIPGEAGAAVLLSATDDPKNVLLCHGIGLANEAATIESEEPLRAEGLRTAFLAAMDSGACSFDDVDYRLTDLSGEQYGYKEAALAIGRSMKRVKPKFDIWHPADCIGEVGAAIVPAILSVAQAASVKGYAPGDGILVHCGNDDGRRAAMVLRYVSKGAA